MTMSTGSGRRMAAAINRDVLLRALLLVVTAILVLVFANTAASLFQVWELDPGAPVPSPWRGLFGTDQATTTSSALGLLGTALFAGASLSCLVFLAERLLRDGWTWLREKLGR